MAARRRATTRTHCATSRCHPATTAVFTSRVSARGLRCSIGQSARSASGGARSSHVRSAPSARGGPGPDSGRSVNQRSRRSRRRAAPFSRRSRMTQRHSRTRLGALLIYMAMAVLGTATLGASRLAAQAAASSGTAEDREGVRRAVLDYVEGFYEGDSLKLARAVRPEVYKYGFYKGRDAAKYTGMQMTWPGFFDYARGIKQNNRQAPATAPKTIDIYEVQDQTASAKLTAFWGTDYMLLGKYDGKWMISHVLWQGPVASRSASR